MKITESFGSHEIDYIRRIDALEMKENKTESDIWLQAKLEKDLQEFREWKKEQERIEKKKEQDRLEERKKRIASDCSIWAHLR